MRSICFFVAYFRGSQLPPYIQVYLKELKKQFGEVLLLCSQPNLDAKSSDFLKAENIQLQAEKNEGFDFGLWYQAFQKTDVSAYDQIALVNDSGILFASLDGFMNWSRNNKAHMQGMTQSTAIAPHLQSYFLLINKPAIGAVKDYFNQHKIIADIHEVIKTYEVGMSSYLLSKGFSIAAYVDNDGYSGEFSPYYHCLEHHIAQGIPLIKKKIIFSSYRKNELGTLARMNFNISKQHYIRLIRSRHQQLLLDLNQLDPQGEPGMSIAEKIRYNLKRLAIQWLRPVYKKIKHHG